MGPSGAAVAGAVPASRGADNSREVFGWTMYDWANSGFTTTVVTVLLGPYLTSLAQAAVGENGTVLDLGPLGVVTAKSLYARATATSVLLQVLLLPALGAIADYTNLKKRLLALFAGIGVVATCLLFLITGPLYLFGALLYIIANVSFGAAMVFYNAFLPEISSDERRDAISSRGFAMGYLGGGLLLLANLALVTLKPGGISTGLAVRLSLLSAGLWWGGFGAFALRRLHAREAARSLPPGRNLLTIGLHELRDSFRELRRLPATLRYLIAYLLYNDGIQTVIALASVFLVQELYVARGRPEDEAQSFVIVLILMVQFVAFAGAIGFGRLAAMVGAKRAILVSLAIWAGVVIYAYGFLQTNLQAQIMAATIALVLGGSQALSRSLFSRMIPAGREASFFGLYEISERGTSWIGPLVFAIVVEQTNSYRQAILSLIVLFIAGFVVLALTDTARAIREARATEGTIHLVESAPR